MRAHCQASADNNTGTHTRAHILRSKSHRVFRARRNLDQTRPPERVRWQKFDYNVVTAPVQSIANASSAEPPPARTSHASSAPTRVAAATDARGGGRRRASNSPQIRFAKPVKAGAGLHERGGPVRKKDDAAGVRRSRRNGPRRGRRGQSGHGKPGRAVCGQRVARDNARLHHAALGQREVAPAQPRCHRRAAPEKHLREAIKGYPRLVAYWLAVPVRGESTRRHPLTNTQAPTNKHAGTH